MPNYIIIHEHGSGTDIYKFTTDDDFDLYKEFLNIEDECGVTIETFVAQLLGLNFEPWKNEVLSVLPEEPTESTHISREEWENERDKLRKENSQSF